MKFGFTFLISNILLGVGLAMDAFSVSLANGLHEQNMKKRKMCVVAGTFAFFQALMPMLGWFCVHTITQCFREFEKCIPWIALLLLGYIGINMLIEGLKSDKEEEQAEVGVIALLVQGIATSIDALSTGFVISEYQYAEAILAVVIIAAVTFVICIGGVIIGKKAGTKLAGKASVLGGIILIVIGIEIFVTSWF